MAGWRAISLGTSSIEESASISVRTKYNQLLLYDISQVMSFMGNRDLRRNYSRVRSTIASIAEERMRILLERARDAARKNGNLSRRYVGLARKISMRTKVRIPRAEKLYLCRDCGIALVPGLNARIRLRQGKNRIAVTCLSCGGVKRYPLPRKRTDRKGHL